MNMPMMQCRDLLLTNRGSLRLFPEPLGVFCEKWLAYDIDDCVVLHAKVVGGRLCAGMAAATSSRRKIIPGNLSVEKVKAS